jgi:DNA-directed RNA polymerase I and III subunit RPAC2
MSAKPIIQGHEFPVITPTAIKEIDDIPVEVDKNRVRVVRSFSFS